MRVPARPARRWRAPLWFALLGAWLAGAATAHTLMPTLVLVSFGQPGSVDIKIDADLLLLLGSPEAYYQLATLPPARQQEMARRLAPRLTANLQLFAGSQLLQPRLTGFSVAQASKADFLDASTNKASTFRFVAALPVGGGPLRLVLPIGADISYPIAYTVQVPARGLSRTRWLDEGMHESDPFAWAGLVPAGAAAVPAAMAPFDPDALPWWRQLALYLRLGFHHIVPQGVDHILFVLGLFFLGITWRKLLLQTTVFTIAHASTLFLSMYGIFRLPSHIVEPAIALSITWIAIENVVRPRLGPGRLAIVFCFGLLHGLGFASSLSAVPFPRRQFIFALLGFNFGVDAGQLFVIAVAFVLVGWFRNRSWFRARIAIPCSLVIAAIGLFWAAQRIAVG